MVPTVYISMIVMGCAIAIVWTKDILFNDEIDLSNGLFKARDPSGGGLFWLHWLAEYATACGLVTGGIGLFAEAHWSRCLSAFALGALFYTSVNSLGWTFARRDRFVYAVPMLVGVLVSLSSLTVLFLSDLPS